MRHKHDAEAADIPCAGLILPGGGARGAYQAGVLKAIADLVPDDRNPFPVVVGSSVGAINAAAIACHARDFRTGAAYHPLSQFSRKVSGTKIFRETKEFGPALWKATFPSSSPLTPATQSGLREQK